MKTFEYNDGGRSKYFKADKVKDCVTRSIAIASGMDYKEVYDFITNLVGYTARNGIKKSDTRKIMDKLGYKWVATMTIGSGCKVHLKADELPKGRIICSCSGHLVAAIDGVINDTYDSTRGGTRCVYGYWIVK